MKNFGNSSRGRSQGVPKIFRAPTYRAHCAVIFAIAQLSHEVPHWLYTASRGFPATARLLLGLIFFDYLKNENVTSSSLTRGFQTALIFLGLCCLGVSFSNETITDENLTQSIESKNRLKTVIITEWQSIIGSITKWRRRLECVVKNDCEHRTMQSRLNNGVY